MTVAVSPPARIDLVDENRKITRPWRDYLEFISALNLRDSGHAIEYEGIAITQRQTMNFVGAGVTVTDVGGKTQVTILGTVPTVVVTTSGTTETVPKSTTALLGTDITYILAVPGYVDITTQGGDTVQVDGSQTTIRLDNDGASVTLRYLSLTTLGIV